MNKSIVQKKGDLESLKKYISSNPYIDMLEQPKICKKFNIPYSISIFRAIYRQRFYNFLLDNTTTVATVSKVTKIPHKYLCEVKAYFEKKGLLKVLYLDRCPTTTSKNVQFISTNKEVWSDETLIPKANQLKLF